MDETIASRVTAFNNAGVLCFENSYNKKAWEFFKGALELKLAAERQEDILTYSNVLNSNEFVFRAESLLEALLVEERTGQPTQPPNVDEKIVGFGTPSFHEHFKEELGDIFFSPFLYKRAFPIAERIRMNSEQRARYSSAVVIFNLTVVEHSLNRQSVQVVPLYELAASLIVGEAMDLLGVAINNIGVWCYENGDHDAAQRCMDHLHKLMCDPGSRDMNIEGDDRRSIVENTVCILTPKGNTSAAA